jgi:hypothetical protein
MDLLTGNRDGITFSPEFDYDRLNKQARAVYDVMKDGQWRSLRQISDITHAPEASVSARLRDFRKPRFGGLTVERKRVTDGLWFYRLIPDGCLL